MERTPSAVEQPAVVTAADPVVLNLAVEQRGTAMGATGIQQPDGALLVAVDDEVLTEHANLSWQLPDLV